MVADDGHLGDRAMKRRKDHPGRHVGPARRSAVGVVHGAHHTGHPAADLAGQHPAPVDTRGHHALSPAQPSSGYRPWELARRLLDGRCDRQAQEAGALTGQPRLAIRADAGAPGAVPRPWPAVASRAAVPAPPFRRLPVVLLGQTTHALAEIRRQVGGHIGDGSC